jgi:hypothetical protein
MFRIEFAGRQVGNKTFRSWKDAQKAVSAMFAQAEQRVLNAEIKNASFEEVVASHSLLHKLNNCLSIAQVRV